MKFTLSPFWRVICSIGLLATAASCTHQMPLVSHAHIGHSLDYWHDTPDNMGLYEVANSELKTAIQATERALDGGLTTLQRRAYLGDALHALDPERRTAGAGLGYGAVRAWRGALEHLEYAATSEDASENIVTTVARLAHIGDEIGNRLASATQGVQIAVSDQHADAAQAAHTLRRELLNLYQGEDRDGDGTVAITPQEAGVSQLVAQLNKMLGREADPRYEPLPRRYVLGLVRLPNGTWGFRLRGAGSGAYGY